MLRARDAKTGWERRKYAWVGVGIISVLLGAFAFQRLAESPAFVANTVPLDVGSATLRLEVADDSLSRQLGLSARERLAENAGMLFVFEKAGRHCIWMKDMRLSIDMLWLDQEKNVLKIKENVSPETYPESFCPDKPARYVIELNAGAARQAGIAAGSRLNF